MLFQLAIKTFNYVVDLKVSFKLSPQTLLSQGREFSVEDSRAIFIIHGLRMKVFLSFSFGIKSNDKTVSLSTFNFCIFTKQD